MSFFIPETCHKRIIGVGGKNIQRIMKKFGVYVKFSNAEEFAMLGGYFENNDNVIARTPAKNSENLQLLKEAVLELINVNEADQVKERVEVPWQLHRALIGFRGANQRELEQKFNVQMLVPDRESGSDEILVSGERKKVEQAIKHIQV
jgi:transcription antitermination factor NusA-like protein